MQFDRLGVVLVAALLAGRAHAAEDIRVMPRDFTIAAIMDGYSVALGCSETMLRVVERTAEQCADLLALAKKTCRAKIADGLPDKLDERDAYRLASRSKACIIRTIRGEAYRNEPADRESETLWKRDHGEQ
jgi:hypothetical protein